MDLNLADDDAALLLEILDTTLRELRMEIAGTDNHEYKLGLKRREDSIRTLIEKLGGSAASS